MLYSCTRMATVGVKGFTEDIEELKHVCTCAIGSRGSLFNLGVLAATVICPFELGLPV